MTLSVNDVRAAIAGAAGKPCSIRIVLEFTDSAVTRAIDDRRTLKGTPADVIEQIRGYADAGVSELVIDANSSDVEATRACYRRFCDEVITKL
jgi:alkanesulfonate monooxygenase SsuD/methylene tetrahydromethanopterin reductase-like flavin-dependent oxidoreductase (luciferase family)